MTGIKDGLGGGTGLSEDIRHEFTNGVIVRTDNKLYFRDSGLYVQSDADGQLLVSSDGAGTNAIKLNGNTTVSGAIALTGSVAISGGALTLYGDASIKLNSRDGTNKFEIVDEDNFPLFRIDSSGNLKLKGEVQKI